MDAALDVKTIDETFTDAGGTTTLAPAYSYGYDAVYRLVGATYDSGTGLTSETFPYDEAGNRDDDAGSSTPWDYDDNNRILASPGVTYTPDADGNLATRTEGSVTRSFSFDATNRLEKVEEGSTTLAEYRYDPFGRRIRKIAGGSTTYYLWDGDQLLAEYSGSGRLRRYAYAGGFAPVQMVPGPGGECSDFSDNDGDGDADLADADCTSATDPTEGTELAVHTDHLDTPRVLTDAAGNAVWHAGYEAFGAVPGGALDEDPDGDSNTVTFDIRFPGQYYDEETGLHSNRHRYYSPELGRYISADLVGQQATTNIFTYAYGDPINWGDLSGIAPVSAPALPDGSPAPPPVAPPPSKQGNPQGWRPVSGTPDRPTKWVPQSPTPTSTGGQPSASWDPDNGHWDVDDGSGNRTRYLPDGTPVDHDNNPVTNASSSIDDFLSSSFCAQNPGVCAALATGGFLTYQAGKVCGQLGRLGLAIVYN